jgi:hypothetical protein
MSGEPLRRVALCVLTALGLGSISALGQLIDTCGQVSISAGCVVFAADSGGTYVLTGAAGVGNGDRIHVVGTVDLSCTPSCIAATGCITATSTGSCGAQFSACGTLVQRGVCLVFQADSGGTFLLDQTSGFVAGDRVQVIGQVDSTCVNDCGATAGCINVTTLNACGVQFDGCGVLTQRSTCVVFVADNGDTFAIDTLGTFGAGDRVRVTGNLDANCVDSCAPLDGCITGNTIAACATSFAGCGTLVQGSGCVLFQADTGESFSLANLGAFQVGDRVRVSGALGGACVTTCANAQTCIADNTIELCQTVFAECGRLIQGADCVLFQADSGGSYLLDNLAGFAVGDRVRVVGTLDADCFSACLPTSGCIHDNTLSAGASVCAFSPSFACPAASAGFIGFSLLGLFRGRRLM